MRKLRNLGLTTIFAAALTTMTVLSPQPVAAQETIGLTVVSGFPPNITWVREFERFYIPAADAALALTGNYKINWNKAWSGQITKVGGELEAVETGLADMGLVVVPFETDKIPLYAIAFFTPFVTNDVNLMSRTIDQLAAKYPKMLSLLDGFNQVPLASLGAVDSYQLAVQKPINNLSDLQGRKIGGAGPNLPWIEGLGATGVSTNLGAAYNHIKTGVMEGLVINAGGANNIKLYEVAPYLVMANLGASTSFIVSANKDRWNTLPQEVREVLRETAKAYAVHTGMTALMDSREGIDAYKANNGSVIEISTEERKKWALALPNFAQKWAEDMEAKGLPGKAILSDYMNAMRAAKQPIARQWDRE